MTRRGNVGLAVAPPSDTGVEEALRVAIAHGLPFRGLRDRAIDYRLFSYLPFALAQRELVLPLSLDGDTLTVASATVEPDLSELRASFPALPVRLVIAPGAEIRALLDAVERLAA